MALSGDTVDVPILPPSQQTPITAAAVGELRMATNAVAKRYAHDKGNALKISKRNGVHLMTAEVRDPNGINAPVLPSGGLTPMANPRLMASLGDRQLVVTASENPFVLAQNVPAWERFDYELPTQTLRQRIVFTDNNQMTIPDGAAVGDVYCYVWSRLEAGAPGQTFVAFYDADGTPIRLPFPISSPGGRVKVVADGTYFWVFVDTFSGSTLTGVAVTLFNTAGQFLVVGTIAYSSGRPWDVTYSPDQGVNFLGTDGTNAVLTKVTVSSLVIGFSSRTFPTTKASISAQFCTNTTGDGFLYIATVDFVSYSDEVFGGVIQEGVFAYKLPAAGTTPTTSWLGPVVDSVQTGIAGTGFNAPEQNIANISGWARGGGALELFIGVINTDDPALNYTKPARCLADATHTGRPIKRGVSVGSRAFGLGTLGVSVLYYASVQGTLVDGKATVGQPTFFFVEMTSGHDQVCGRFDYGQAAMDYTALGVAFPAVGNGFIAQGTYLFHLPSPFLDAEGGVHLPLCYRAESGFQTQALGILRGSTGPSYIARVVSTVGLKDTQVGPRHGRAVDYAGEMFLPGPIATSFTGSSFSEAGVNLAPEMPTVTVDVGGPGFLGTGTYSIAVVFEWTTPNGDRAKSQPSAFVQATTPADGRRLIIVGKSLGMTSRKDVMISIYRTYKTLDSLGNSVMSTIHAKVTNDLRPLFNDPNSDTWTFTDTMSDVACSVNEPLYSDEGELFHDPAPAFSCGCVADNRVMLAGYDNYVWFSAEKTPGASFWFNQDAWRIPLPTDDFVVALEPMDNRVLIICERSLWFIPLQQFPDATGQGGSVPAPQRLPFTNGGTGFTCQTRDGVMYSSSAKDVWTIARDLSNVRSGAPVIEETENQAVVGMSVDIDQRISVPLNDGKICTWDVVAQVWLVQTFPVQPVLSMTFQGRLTYMDVAGFCWRQDDTSFYDGPLYGSEVKIPIITTVDILPVHLGGVKNLKRIWDVFAYGEYRGDHDLHLRVTYDDERDLTTVVPYDFTPDPGLPFLYSFRPKVEQCSAMAFRFFDSFPRGGEPGDSFALELLSFYVGLEKGLVRRPKAIRIPSGVPTYFIPGAQNDGLAQVIVVQSTTDLGAFALVPAKTYLSGHTVGIVADTGAMYFLASTAFTPDGVNIIDSSDGRQWLTSGTATTFSPNGQAQVATVQSLAELATFILLPAACFVSGHVVAVVEDSGRMYYLADTGTPDGSNIVTASDGRQWIGI